jgi:ABC-type sugar transport system substrate-binding protein
MHKLTIRRRVFATAAFISGAALIMTGCASSSGGADAAGSRTVGATLLSLEYPFLVALNDSMKSEASTQDVNLVSLDPRQKTATELTQIEDLITQKVNAVVMIPVDQKASQTAARKVNKAGIPLILVNTKFSDDFNGDYVSYVGSDDTEAGKIEGKYLATQLPNGGNVVYLVGQYGGASTERRKAGFDDAIAASPNLKIVTETEAKGSRAEAKRIMEDLLQRYPKGELQAVVAQSDEMALGASSAIAEAGRSAEFTVIIGVDGSDAGLKAVKDGSMTATVFQDAVGQGKAAMKVAAKILAGKKVDKEINIPFQLVTKDNLSDFLK